MHHYTESGLDNVWLKNGYTVRKTPYGKAVAVSDADALHEVLAMWDPLESTCRHASLSIL